MAHASCYAMALSHTLNEAGTPPERLQVSSVVTVEQVPGGIKVGESRLDVRGKVPGIDQAKFEELARRASRAARSRTRCATTSTSAVKATLEQ